MVQMHQCSAYVGLLTKPLTDCDVDAAKTSELYEIIRTYDQLETPAKILQLERLVLEILGRKENETLNIQHSSVAIGGLLGVRS